MKSFLKGLLVILLTPIWSTLFFIIIFIGIIKVLGGDDDGFDESFDLCIYITNKSIKNKKINKHNKNKKMKVLLLTSYCKGDDCYDNYPCLDCLDMCNVFEIDEKDVKKNLGGMRYLHDKENRA